MGKKYIVEIGRLERLYKAFVGVHGKPEITWLSPEVDLTPYTEPNMEQVRKEAYDKAFEDAKQVAESGKRAMYQKGLKDAWDAARKIAVMPDGKLEAIFGTSYLTEIFTDYSASECIEKIRAYEQKQDEIQVGDEVELKCSVSPAIYMQGTNDSDEIYLLFNDGSCGIHGRDEIECKTGRHFPEIADVLAKMKESDNG